MEQISNKAKYAAFCETEKNIPVFLQPWWMDAVCINGEWEALLYEEKGFIRGVLLYYTLKKYGFKMVLQPMLTQYNGIWLKYSESLSNKEKLSFEKKATAHLIKQLEEKIRFHFYRQNFTPKFTNWLPFYWKNYRQTTRYTYQIKDISDPEKCFSAFDYNKKAHIRKAEKELTIDNNVTADEFYAFLELYHSSQQKKVYYSKSFFARLYDSCIAKNSGKIIAVKDQSGIMHAALFVVWDNEKGYDLISVIHPEHKNTGGSTLVVFEAIKQLSEKVKVFDFEGSMIENVENSFSQFGTEQIPYFSIYKYNSVLLKMLLKFVKQ